MDNTLGLPEDQLLHTINKNMPFVFLADEAFALTNRIMKPYSGMHEKASSSESNSSELDNSKSLSIELIHTRSLSYSNESEDSLSEERRLFVAIADANNEHTLTQPVSVLN
nr:unnamed protein product [Callosobruchus chinensis]